MKKTLNLLLLVVVLLLQTKATFAQQQTSNEKTYRTIEVEKNNTEVFNQCIDYWFSMDYFILSIDQNAGFIQAKKFTPINKVFSFKNGDKETYNFLIRPVSSNTSKITLSIYLETQYYSGSDSKVFYYEDKGISQDEMLYTKTLNNLFDYIVQKQSK